jgi:predicted DNA-binding antitoxin AbrB/MazE fold protein
VYENGIFRPVGPIAQDLEEGQHVRLVVETHAPEEILGMAADVYAGLSERDIDEIEQVALDRSSFFSERAR